jgi:hypothetical protein
MSCCGTGSQPEEQERFEQTSEAPTQAVAVSQQKQGLGARGRDYPEQSAELWFGEEWTVAGMPDFGQGIAVMSSER